MSYENRFVKPNQEECFSLSAIIVLDKMIKKNRPFCTLLEGDDTYLEDLLDFLGHNLTSMVSTDDEEWKTNHSRLLKFFYSGLF